MDFGGNITNSNAFTPSPGNEQPDNSNTRLVLDGTNTADNTISGIISDNLPGTNNTRVAKGGSGTWVLTGANTYTGWTQIDQGTLKIQANAPASTIIADASNLVFQTITGNQPGPDNTFLDFSKHGCRK